MNVGFIGLGAMGLSMAKRVLGGGHKMYTTFHRRREPAQELRAMGAELLQTPGEVADAADVVVDEAIRAKGGSVLDAPVSGGTPAAEQGTLTIMVGGDQALLERCRPLLQTMGSRIVHVGKVGQGKIIKIVNQMMAAMHPLTIGEAFTLGINSGADPATLYEVIKTSSGYSKMMDLRLPGFLLEGSFKPGFKLDLMKKDVNLALESAKASNTPLLLTSVAAQVFAAVSAAGKGGEDFSVAAQFVAALAGVNLSESKTKSA